MTHTVHFASTDSIMAHLQTFVPNLPVDLQAQYTGFATVSAVTVYELAIKEILIEFSRKKHQTFGFYVEDHYEKINGRIGLRSLKSEHLPKFGSKYLPRFEKLLESEEKQMLMAQGGSVKASYGNIVTWRNGFAHGGKVPVNATFMEAARAYELGKTVIDCLARAMVR